MKCPFRVDTKHEYGYLDGDNEHIVETMECEEFPECYRFECPLYHEEYESTYSLEKKGFCKRLEMMENGYEED